MDHYIDVKLMPDPEFTGAVLMSALYNKLHRALVSMKADDIGVSFPEYQLKPKALGTVLRVHGSHTSLSTLLEAGWLKGMMDHIEPVAITGVPQTTQFLLVKRKQYKTNADRLRRRRMKRKGETWKQVCQAIPDQLVPKVDCPFATLRSQSSGQTFALFIDQRQASEVGKGKFNSYGLSKEATVPWF